jgi:hypothetical protein
MAAPRNVNNPASGYTNPKAAGNQSAAPKPAAPKPAVSAAATKQKEADKKMLAQAQALLAKQKATLAKLEKAQAEYKQATNPSATYNQRVVDAIKAGTQSQVNVDAYLPGTGTNRSAEEIQNEIELQNIAKGLNPDGTPKKEGPSKETQDAYALLEAAFKLYGLDSLVPVIRGYMEDDLGPEQAKLKLKTEPLYKERFRGNELRIAAGRNALSEVDYLTLEDDYTETLKSYGLSDYFGVATNAATRSARQKKMAEVIGGDISADEFKERIKTVVTRVNMADTNTKDALKSLYNITETDLIKYFLNPTEGSDTLKRKVTVAEISAASMTAGLGQTSLAAAEDLARLGIDKAKALVGYENIAAYLPTAEKLSAIYNVEGINYNKATGEDEEFRGLASAKRKRDRLKERETSAFSGSSGTSQVSLKTRTAGQI